VAAAALVSSAATACGGGAGGHAEIARLDDELERVMFEVKLAQGFNFDVNVDCSSNGSDTLHFTCRVVATTPGRPANAWDEIVTCQPPQHADIPRCTTASGYALE
jgi:hypothetical protein